MHRSKGRNEICQSHGLYLAAARLFADGFAADPQLAGLREPAELKKLSADERKECLALWDSVGVIYARAGRAR